MSSSSHEIKTKCPYCGKEFDITIYTSIDPETDPDLRDRCISGDIFRQLCPHCHTEYMTQYPLVYKNIPDKFILWLSSAPMSGSTEEAVNLAKKGYTLRRCATLEEFAEKIRIFEDHMNDIAVELAKYDSFIEFLDNRNGKPEDVTSIEYQKVDNDVIKINIRMEDKGMSFLIPVSVLEEEIRAEADLYHVNNEEFPLVNSDWIISLFMKPAGQA